MFNVCPSTAVAMDVATSTGGFFGGVTTEGGGGEGGVCVCIEVWQRIDALRRT